MTEVVERPSKERFASPCSSVNVPQSGMQPFTHSNLNWQRMLAVSLAVLFTVSLPFKIAPFHFAAGGLALMLLTARRSELSTQPLRLYCLVSLAWLIPVLVASFWHEFNGPATGSSATEALKVLARILALGMAWLMFIQRGWLSLRTTVLAALVASALMIGSGYHELFMQLSAGRALGQNLRISGWVFNPNPFGMFMALSIILGAAILGTKQARWWPWILIAAATPLLLASGSRGAMVGTVLGLLCLISPVTKRHLIALAAIGAAIGAAYAFDLILLHRGTSDDVRSELLTLALAKWLAAPWLGWGIDTFPYLEGNRLHLGTHNIVTDLAVSCGGLAAVGWLYAAARVGVGLIKHPGRTAKCLLAAFAVILVGGMTDYSILTMQFYQGLWMLISAHACWQLRSSS